MRVVAPPASAGVEARAAPAALLVVQAALVELVAVAVAEGVGDLVVAQEVPVAKRTPWGRLAWAGLVVVQAVPAAERTPLGQLTWAALVAVEAARQEAAVRRAARLNESSSQRRL